MTWQSIDSAPKSDYIIGAWKDGKWHAREMWWDDSVQEWTDTMGDYYLRPTHWVPLPCSDVCDECGGSGVVPYRTFDGTEEGHIEESACACRATTAGVDVKL